MNFRDNILKMRSAFKAKKNRFSDRLSRKPPWVNGHEINGQYLDQDYLLANGEVYYASLLQANVALFKSGVNNYGAVIIIGTNKFYDEDPMTLRKIAHNIFKYKDQKDVPQNISKFAQIITDERQYVFNMHIPKELTFDFEAIFTTLIIDRHHLPKRKLVGGLFPVIAVPDKVKTCMVLPRRFWTKEMEDFYLGKIRVPVSSFGEGGYYD